MGTTYTEKYTVTCYETDSSMKLRLFSLLNYAQEIAYRHATALGFGYDALMENNLAWVLSRMLVKVNRMPLWRDEISIETWHRGQDKVFSVRDFVVRDKNGEELVTITSSWLIINVMTRRIHRFDRLLRQDQKIEDYINPQACMDCTAYKIEIPSDPIGSDAHTVKYSDIDLNAHVNNAKYIEWAMDRVYNDIPENGELKEFCVNFNHEARLGQRIEFTKFISDKIGDASSYSTRDIYVEGTSGEENLQNFITRFVYRMQ